MDAGHGGGDPQRLAKALGEALERIEPEWPEGAIAPAWPEDIVAAHLSLLRARAETEAERVVVAGDAWALRPDHGGLAGALSEAGIGGWPAGPASDALPDAERLRATLDDAGADRVVIAHGLADIVAGGADMARIAGGIGDLAEALGLPVLACGYDHVARPDLGPALRALAREQSVENAARTLNARIDAFHDALAAEPRIAHVDLRQTIGTHVNSWADALHPRAAGYSRAAARIVRRLPNAEAPEDATPGDAPEDRPGSAVATEATMGMIRGAEPDFAARGAEEAAGADAEAHDAGALIARTFNPDRLELTDFEAMRAALGRIPDDRARWRRFADPLIHEHIEEVLSLAGLARRPEDADTVIARNATSADGRIREAETGTMPELDAVPLSPAEALFGDDELEPVRILLRGFEAARAVGRVQIIDAFGYHRGHGTGFLVAPGLFLTNAHVLPDPMTAARSFVVFDDEDRLDGGLSRPVRVRITPDLYVSPRRGRPGEDPDRLDYAFVSVARTDTEGGPLTPFGHLPLIPRSGKAIKFEPVSIIQHPGGEAKAIAIRNSFVMGRARRRNAAGDVVEELPGIYYTTDTRGGASGSPVLNREWQVVALHHRYVPHPTETGVVLANRGIRVSQIFADLERRAENDAAAREVLDRLSAERSPTESEAPMAGPVLAAARPPAEPDDGLVESGAYAGLSLAEMQAACGPGETRPDDVPLPTALSPRESGDLVPETLDTSPETVLRRVGPEGYRLIVAFEVSSRAHYERRLKRPVVPGGASGVTIGIGYDLGHQSESAFRACWADLLPDADMRRLTSAIGLTGGAARARLGALADIEVPYEAAVSAFERDSLPRYYAMLARHIDAAALDALPPACVGALVSITYNRGPSFSRSGDRYREMRAIRAAVNAGRAGEVPAHIRSMKRIWAGKPNLRGLLRRRDAEADLFADGLDDDAGMPMPPPKPR